MAHYGQPLRIKQKSDGSPLTLVDKLSHDAICKHLALSGLKVVSEEGDDCEASRYWLIDPLDGTKDFLAGTDEFTINIALIDNKQPVLGVVFAPAANHLYWGGQGFQAWRLKNEISTLLTPKPKSRAYRMAVSRFHDHPDVDLFARQNGVVHRVAIGSALKYCLLAAATIDIFPRLVGSSEWDSAAGQAILEGAGGRVLDWNTGKSLTYGKMYRRNPRLLCFRAPYDFSEFKLIRYKDGLL